MCAFFMAAGTSLREWVNLDLVRKLTPYLKQYCLWIALLTLGTLRDPPRENKTRFDVCKYWHNFVWMIHEKEKKIYMIDYIQQVEHDTHNKKLSPKVKRKIEVTNSRQILQRINGMTSTAAYPPTNSQGEESD